MPKPSVFAKLFRSNAAKAEDDEAKRKARRMADQEDADEDAEEDRDEDDVVDKVVEDAEDDLKDPADPNDDPDAKKAKRKAKAKDGDADSDDADQRDPKASAARARERGRIAAIMRSPAAAANPAGAMLVALRTNASREEAISAIAELGGVEPSKARAQARLRGVDVPDVGSGGGSDGSQARGKALADQIIAAGRRARGEV